MQQVTGDSGSGAVFGDNVGRVAAFGPAASYRWPIADTPVVFLLKYDREFAARNTTQGNAVTLSARCSF